MAEQSDRSLMPELPQVRLIRSLLLVPPREDRFIARAPQYAADAIMFDLDDCVAYSDAEKVAARRRVAAALTDDALAGRLVAVRTNALDTPWWRDEVAELGRLRPTALCPAKVKNPQQLDDFVAVMHDAGVSPEVEIWPMIETPGAVLFAEPIAAKARVTTLFFGVGDFTIGTKAQFADDFEQIRYALGQVVCAGRYHERECIGPTLVSDITRQDLMYGQARTLRRMGYGGAACIHPAYLPVINEVFSPSQSELRQAVRIVRAYRQSIARGEAALLLDGLAVERVHVVNALETIARGQAAEIPEAYEPT